jgi:hypothetical protein
MEFLNNKSAFAGLLRWPAMRRTVKADDGRMPATGSAMARLPL